MPVRAVLPGMDVFLRSVDRMLLAAAPEINKALAQIAETVYQFARQPSRRMKAPSIRAISIARIAIECRIGRPYQAFAADKAGQYPHGEGAAAEAEQIDSIARLVVAADEFVAIQDVAFQAPAEGAA